MFELPFPELFPGVADHESELAGAVVLVVVDSGVGASFGTPPIEFSTKISPVLRSIRKT